jgi:hypothetical protein
MKQCSTSLPIKEMQIKNTLRFFLISVRLAITKKINKNAGEDAGGGGKGTFIHC